jgi:hypothetical protein
MAFRRPFLTVIAFALVTALAACNLPSQAGLPDGAPLATPSQPVPQTLGQCKNPLHPVIKGAAWTYSLSGITSGTFTRTITAIREDGFTDQDVYDSGVTRTGEWKCEDGTLTALSPAEGLSSMINQGRDSSARDHPVRRHNPWPRHTRFGPTQVSQLKGPRPSPAFGR